MAMKFFYNTNNVATYLETEFRVRVESDSTNSISVIGLVNFVSRLVPGLNSLIRCSTETATGQRLSRTST